MARWALIAGPKSSDKTAHAFALMEALQEVGVVVGGFLQAKHVDDEQRKHYDLVRLPSLERAHLAQEAIYSNAGPDVTFCALRFDEDAFRLALEWVEEDRHKAEVLFVGDISKVEVSGGGHSQAVSSALAMPDDKLAVLCVRADQLFYVVEKFGLEDDLCGCLELPADPETCRSFYRDVIEDTLAQRKEPSGR